MTATARGPKSRQPHFSSRTGASAVSRPGPFRETPPRSVICWLDWPRRIMRLIWRPMPGRAFGRIAMPRTGVGRTRRTSKRATFRRRPHRFGHFKSMAGRLGAAIAARVTGNYKPMTEGPGTKVGRTCSCSSSAKAAWRSAERAGFEPAVEFPPHSISSAAPSAARSPLRFFASQLYQPLGTRPILFAVYLGIAPLRLMSARRRLAGRCLAKGFD